MILRYLLPVLLLAAWPTMPLMAEAFPAGWGVDACISCHARPGDRPGYLKALSQARLTYVRERNPGNLSDPANRESGALAVFARHRAAGLRVVAFLELGPGLVSPDSAQEMPDDLGAVYEAARAMSVKAAGYVNVWEIGGEPDAYFCKGLPDRYVAFQKAVYLGIKDGAGPGPAPGVLMAGLAHAPGPWLQRAARNGLYDYTDGANFHFYGHAADLAGVIAAHRASADRFSSGRELPLWITECGINVVVPGDPENPAARELQRAFTLTTARTAYRLGVSVFMPFLLVGANGDGHALLQSPTRPWPAWPAYVRYTRTHELGPGSAIVPPQNPGRVVLQWVADDGTCTPHKVSGGYWFDPLEGEDTATMAGELQAWNLSPVPVRGRLNLPAPVGFSLRTPSAGPAWSEVVEIPAFGCLRRPLVFAGDLRRYRRETVRATFQPIAGPVSRLEFGLETRPNDALLPRVFRLEGRRPGATDFRWIWAPQPFRITSAAGPWLGLNGVTVSGPGDGRHGPLDAAWHFEIAPPSSDPRFPPMAVTRVAGLPSVADGFLRVRIPDGVSLSTSVRVDLVDRRGQRFTIAENFGRNPADPDAREVFLSYRDLHLYAWGRCTTHPDFHPQDIREIQLRFFPAASCEPTAIRIDLVAPAPVSLSHR